MRGKAARRKAVLTHIQYAPYIQPGIALLTGHGKNKDIYHFRGETWEYTGKTKENFSDPYFWKRLG